jgi:hypothetical protein
MDLTELDFDQAELDISTAPVHQNAPTLGTHFSGECLDPFPDAFLHSVSGPEPPSTDHSWEVLPRWRFGCDLAAFNSGHNDANRPDPSVQFRAISELESIVETPDLDLLPISAINPQLLVNPVAHNDPTFSILNGFQALEMPFNHSPSTMLVGQLSPAELSTAAFTLDEGLPAWRNTAEAPVEPPLPVEKFTTALQHNVGSMDSITAEPILAEDHPWQITTTSTTVSSRPVKPAEKPMKRSNRTTPKRKLKECGEILPGRFILDLNSDDPPVPVRKRYSDSRRKEIQQLKAPGACLRCSTLKIQVSPH